MLLARLPLHAEFPRFNTDRIRPSAIERTHEEAGTLEDVYEPFLIQQGLIKRTPRGREATPLAYRHLGLEPPPGTGNGRSPASAPTQPELPLS